MCRWWNRYEWPHKHSEWSQLLAGLSSRSFTLPCKHHVSLQPLWVKINNSTERNIFLGHSECCYGTPTRLFSHRWRSWERSVYGSILSEQSSQDLYFFTFWTHVTRSQRLQPLVSDPLCQIHLLEFKVQLGVKKSSRLGTSELHLSMTFTRMKTSTFRLFHLNDQTRFWTSFMVFDTENVAPTKIRRCAVRWHLHLIQLGCSRCRWRSGSEVYIHHDVFSNTGNVQWSLEKGWSADGHTCDIMFTPGWKNLWVRSLFLLNLT